MRNVKEETEKVMKSRKRKRGRKGDSEGRMRGGRRKRKSRYSLRRLDREKK